jgi:hypothetical protein
VVASAARTGCLDGECACRLPDRRQHNGPRVREHRDGAHIHLIAERLRPGRMCPLSCLTLPPGPYMLRWPSSLSHRARTRSRSRACWPSRWRQWFTELAMMLDPFTTKFRQSQVEEDKRETCKEDNHGHSDKAWSHSLAIAERIQGSVCGV